MSTASPFDLLFGGMTKLGPGDDEHTLQVLRTLPKQRFDLVVDAGCGTGRQTLALARELHTTLHAIDLHGPFLDTLRERAKAAKLEGFIRIHHMDMHEIPRVFRGIGLLWSEGAAYNIGFANALAHWLGALREDGLAVVSELSWLKDRAPKAVRVFFRSCYPDMASIASNLSIAESAGYEVLSTHTLPPAAWMDGYYDVLEGRAKSLLDHDDASVRTLVQETLREIEIFQRSDESYGYVFYVLRARRSWRGSLNAATKD